MEPEKKRLVTFLIGLSLVVVTAAAYRKVLDCQFTNFDDNVFITENVHVLHGFTREGALWAFTKGDLDYWRPLSWLSHMLDCRIFGLEPAGHHLTSLMIHIINVILLFLFLNDMTGTIWRSAFVASLFALHPLGVESVAWVAERKNVLSTLFWILTMWSYVCYARKPGPSGYVRTIALFILGLMSKPMLVTLPFVLLLLDYWPLGRTGTFNPPTRLRQVLLEKLPFLMLSVASSSITFFDQRTAGTIASFERLPPAIRLECMPVAYVGYLAKMFWPRGLAVYYPHPGNTLSGWHVAAACLILACIAFAVIRASRRHAFFAVGWLWYLVTLAPVIGIVQSGPQLMADRYAYVPLIGLYLIVAWGMADLVPRRRWRAAAFVISAAVVLFALTVCTWRQVRHWRDSLSLFQHALDVTSNNWLAHNNLGHALYRMGRVDEAVIHYSECLKISPLNASAQLNLANALFKKGNLHEALTLYSGLRQMTPVGVDVLNNLGNVFARLGRPAEAMVHYSEALRMDTRSVEVHNNLGSALASQGDTDGAMAHYLEALRIQPLYASAHNNLGNLMADEGRLDESIRHYDEALRIKPDYLEAHNNLANVLYKKGEFDGAIRHYSAVIRMSPLFVAGYCNLANAYAEAGRFGEAVVVAGQALALARSTGQERIAGEIQVRLKFYKKSEPYPGRK